MKNITIIILAAGKGTRLSRGAPSPKPKVLYEIGGKPIIIHTLEKLRRIGSVEIVIVVGHKAQDVKNAVGEGFIFAHQEKRLGTGHAAKIGLSYASKEAENIMVLNGDDSAFYKLETIKKVVEQHISAQNTITFVTLVPDDPTGLGRILRRNGKVVGVVEEKAATAQQKSIREVNDGLYLFRRDWFEKYLPTIKKSAVGEYYLVDLISLAVNQGEKVEAYKLADVTEWKGVNTPEDLSEADILMKQRTKDKP